MKKSEQKRVEARVNASFARVGFGVQVNIMDLGKIMACGRMAIAEGLDDAGMDERIAALLQQIRKN